MKLILKNAIQIENRPEQINSQSSSKPTDVCMCLGF